MKGRGIGTARGRATIMRANGMSMVFSSFSLSLTVCSARRGRGQPAARGIRR